MATPHERSHTPHRVGAIDVGTNSIRLVVAQAEPDARYRVIDDEKEMTRLGRGLATTGVIGQPEMDASVQAIARFRSIALGYDVDMLRAVATSAVRDASNGREMCERVWRETGIQLEVISGIEEAHLAHRSVAYAFDLRSLHAAIVDIGGGSTEIVLSTAGVIQKVASMPVGAVRMAEQFPDADSDDDQLRALRRFVRDEIRRSMEKPVQTPQVAFGTGGTFTNLARMALCQEKGLSAIDSSVRGYEIGRGRIRHIIDWYRKLPRSDRADVPGLSPDRADIILFGIVIVERVMKHLGINWLRAHDRGIRDGLILEMISSLRNDAPGADPGGPTRRDAALRFAESCRYEVAHCHHVAELSVSIYDQLVALHLIEGDPARIADDRELLECASLLHDIGYIVNYSRHHKHSYHLILHSDLPGFTTRELEIVANVARYHRRAVPKLRHPEFARLEEEDRQRVRRLGAILRIADGIDRSHTQNVPGVRVVPTDDALEFRLIALEDPAVNTWGAQRKRELFESVFGHPATFTWAGHTASRRWADDETRPEELAAGATPPPQREEHG